MGVGDCIPEEINPYKVLDIDNNASIPECKKAFRKLITSSNERKKKLGSLAYDILCNKDNYIRKDNLYSPKVKDHFYYVIIGDLNKLKELYNKNKNILRDKDKLDRNLLYIAAKNGFYNICEFLLEEGMDPNETQKTDSAPIHAASFYNHYSIVKLLLQYGAKTKLVNNQNQTAFDEGYSEKIRKILLQSEKDPIISLLNNLINKNLAKRLILVKYKNLIIGKKILRNEELLPPNIKDIKENWVVGWHGTGYSCLESIMEYGLYPSGTKLTNGYEIKPLEGHVPLGTSLEGFDDWARAIFVSPSIFYAGHPCYAKTVFCNDLEKEEEYSILVETRIKPGEYSEHPPSVVTYAQKNNEPPLVEYKIKVKDYSNLIMRIESERNIVVTSILFAKTIFLKKIKDYYEGEIFVNSKEEQNLFLT